MLNEGNQKLLWYHFITVPESYGFGSGSDFLTSYGSGSGSTRQKITVPFFGSGSGSTTLFVSVMSLLRVQDGDGGEQAGVQPAEDQHGQVPGRALQLSPGGLLPRLQGPLLPHHLRGGAAGPGGAGRQPGSTRTYAQACRAPRSLEIFSQLNCCCEDCMTKKAWRAVGRRCMGLGWGLSSRIYK